MERDGAILRTVRGSEAGAGKRVVPNTAEKSGVADQRLPTDVSPQMTNSRKPGSTNSPMDWRLSPALTPGPLGLFDQSDPNVTTLLGDTPGPLGMNDANDPSMGAFGSALDNAVFISQDTIRRELENDFDTGRVAASASVKPSSTAWERTEQRRVPAGNPAASDRVMESLLANSERFAANKSDPGMWDRITEKGRAVLDATAEAVDDAGRTLRRAVTIDSPDEARERAEQIELRRAQEFRKLLAADLLAHGMIDNGMVCTRVGPMAVAVQSASAHPAYHDSFDQRIARSMVDALELYAGGALIDAVAIPILTAGGKLKFRFLSAESKLSYGLRQDLRSSLHADLRPSAKIDVSPPAGGSKTADVVAPKIARDAYIEPVQASPISSAGEGKGFAPPVSPLGVEGKIEGAAAKIVAGANNTMRETVLANIEASRAGSASSSFDTFAGREALLNEALAANQSPWPLGYTPSVRPMAIGEQFNMVIDANQAQGLGGPGGFATFSDIPNQPFARDTLAITEQFKSDISFLQRYEVVQSFKALEGPIGPQIDQVTGRLLEGSKTIWQLDLQLPWNQRTQYLKPVGTPVPIIK